MVFSLSKSLDSEKNDKYICIKIAPGAIFQAMHTDHTTRTHVHSTHAEEWKASLTLYVFRLLHKRSTHYVVWTFSKVDDRLKSTFLNNINTDF